MIKSGLKLSDYANGKGGYDSPTGQGFDGVVKININGLGYLTGSLLYNGKAILTAAHGFDKGMPNGGNILFQLDMMMASKFMEVITLTMAHV